MLDQDMHRWVLVVQEVAVVPQQHHQDHWWIQNTGGGGAGEGTNDSNDGPTTGDGYNGGSGVVMIAYPT